MLAKRAIDVAGALVAALLAFTAVPAVLLFVVGNPLSGGVGHGWSALARDALCGLTLAAWIAWVACCAELVRSVTARVRHHEIGPRSSSLVDWLARRIALGVLAVTSVGVPVALSSVAGAVAPQLPASTPTLRHTSIEGQDASRPAASAAYVVRAGDSLWSVAQAQLGDGAQWTTLAALNLGRAVSPSERLVDPDHLREGWRIELPHDAHHPNTYDRRHTPKPAPARPAGPSPRAPRPRHRFAGLRRPCPSVTASISHSTLRRSARRLPRAVRAGGGQRHPAGGASTAHLH